MTCELGEYVCVRELLIVFIAGAQKFRARFSKTQPPATDTEFQVTEAIRTKLREGKKKNRKEKYTEIQ